MLELKVANIHLEVLELVREQVVEKDVAYPPFTESPLGDIAKEVMQRSREPKETEPHAESNQSASSVQGNVENKAAHTLRIIRPLDCLDLRMLNHGLEPVKRGHAAARGGFGGRVNVEVYPVVGCLHRSLRVIHYGEGASRMYEDDNCILRDQAELPVCRPLKTSVRRVGEGESHSSHFCM